MAEKTGIEWADATWNPWMGCKKVSPGCEKCYMFRDMTFYGRNPNFIDAASDKTFLNPLSWARNNKLPAGARIFTCSWSDWFIKEADEWRPRAWEVIKMTPQYNYLILTKRVERVLDCLPADWGSGYKNVWLLVSTENQKYYDKRWPILYKDIPAVVKGLSCEPLLGPIALDSKMLPDWIITGGESDKSSPRESDINWFRDIRDFALNNKIPFFHKQHGGKKKIDGAWGGRVLVGKTWDEFPTMEGK